MVAAVFLASNTIGALPLLFAIIVKSISNPAVVSMLAANPNDYSVLGINSNVILMMMLFPFIAALAAFIFLVKPLNHRSFKSVINGDKNIRWNRFFISALIWTVLSLQSIS